MYFDHEVISRLPNHLLRAKWSKGEGMSLDDGRAAEMYFLKSIFVRVLFPAQSAAVVFPMAFFCYISQLLSFAPRGWGVSPTLLRVSLK